MRPATAGGYRLVLLRHGESEWNARNLFSGWVNPPLTPGGEKQAVAAGQVLAEHGLLPGAVHTSVQRRAIRTADLALLGRSAAAAPGHLPRAGTCVLVVSHGNTLRALVKHLDGVSGQDVAALNVPNAVPLAYELGPDMRPLLRGGRYLRP